MGDEQKNAVDAQPEFKPPVLAGNVMGGLVPKSFESLWRMSAIMSKSGLMPDGIKTPEAVFVAVQMGMEIGLSPMAAVQNIAVIHGRPSLWGDAVLGVVRASGQLEDFREFFEGADLGQAKTADIFKAVCIAKRKGQDEEIRREFSIGDAKNAGLWGQKNRDGSPGVWIKYWKRMLQMRARSWTCRDGFSDVLRGFRQVEEQRDAVDLEITDTGSYEVPQAETKPAEDRGAGFDLMMAEKVGDVEEMKAKVEEFLEATAKAGKETIEALKERAATNFGGFWVAFEKWVKRQKPPEPPPKPKESGPMHQGTVGNKPDASGMGGDPGDNTTGHGGPILITCPAADVDVDPMKNCGPCEERQIGEGCGPYKTWLEKAGNRA